MFFKVFSPDCISAGQRKNKLTNRSKVLSVMYHIVGRNPIVFRSPILLVNIMFSLRLRTTGTYLDICFQIHAFFYFCWCNFI